MDSDKIQEKNKEALFEYEQMRIYHQVVKETIAKTREILEREIRPFLNKHLSDMINMDYISMLLGLEILTILMEKKVELTVELQDEKEQEK
jgi:hypothetical protein